MFSKLRAVGLRTYLTMADNHKILFGRENLTDLTNLLEGLNDSETESESDIMSLVKACKYEEPDEFLDNNFNSSESTSFFHLNCRGLCANWEAFNDLLLSMNSDIFSFDFIAISEAFKCEHDRRILLPGYHSLIHKSRENECRGGVGIFVKESIHFEIRQDLSILIPNVIESLFIEYETYSHKKSIVGVIYRPNTPPKADLDLFITKMNNTLEKIDAEKKKLFYWVMLI